MASPKEIIDPLTYCPLREGSLVEVKTDNGSTFKFKLIDIDGDKIILQKPSSKLIAVVDEVLLHRQMVIGKFGVRPGQRVTIKFKDGAPEQWEIAMIANENLLVLSKPGRKKLGLLEKLKFLWNAKGL